ncbi:proton-coupled folate transporter-like isoform X2 [Scylla paramamosain]|uniref:proton-coupled folate transporter-like isoform X2 n=1 Tax=Scylla paramamosain TaxID=85552 RepID=UPI003082AB7F
MFRVTVEPAVFLYCVSQVVQLSVLQDFIFTKLCREQYSQEVCVARWKEGSVTDVAWVENKAVNYVMWLSVITSILSVIMAQFFGVALDRYSPKVVMTAPFMGFLAQHLVCVVVAALPSLPLAVMYVGATLNGLSGGYPLFKSAVSSYVVRTASPEERTFRLSVVEGTVFLGGAVGPFTLNQVVTSTTTGHDYLFLGSEMSLAVALLYIVFILPDSHSTSQENAELPPEHSAESDLRYIYMHNYLGFTLGQYSLYLVIKNLVNGISLLGVLPVLRLVFDISDASLGILGGTSRVVAFTMLALNTSHTLTYIVPFLDVFGQYLFVVLRSSLCGLVKREEQGRVLTVLSSLAQMSMLVGSLLFDNVYPALVLLAHPGYTFLVAATTMATATTIFICIRCCRAKEGTCEETQPILR